MQNVPAIESQTTLRFIDRKCRNLLFSFLKKLQGGELEIIEFNQRNFFGEISKDNDAIKATIVIHDPSVYVDFIKGGSIQAGAAFIDGKWNSPDLTNVIQLFCKAQALMDDLDDRTSWFSKLKRTLQHLTRRNTVAGAKNNIMSHYDLGNVLYKSFLDPEMMYSSAIYPTEKSNLAEAQLHKLKTICERLELSSDDHLLEIGTGWGGLAIYAAQHYGCKVTTTTISEEQYGYAKQRITELGLNHKITLLKQDYRLLSGQFDKLVSIEMIEAVGYQFMESYFRQCDALLKPGGKFLIQAITIKDQRFDYYLQNVDFIQRYIFPGGFLPSVTLISEQFSKNTGLVIELLDDIGLDYARTLQHWRQAFLKSWPKLATQGFDDQFKRLWLYYFSYCEGAFLQRATSTVQIVARK